MPTVMRITDVPDETRRKLEARAATTGTSLNTYLLGVLAREADRPTVAEVLDRAARRAEQAGASATAALAQARNKRERQTSRRPD